MGFPINDDCEYIAAFLTMDCNFNCSYCINKFHGPTVPYSHLTAQQWIQALSKLENLDREIGQIPVTLCGGEPSMHPGFYDIINNVPDRIKIDMLTNLTFDVDEFMARVRPERLKRETDSPSIRVSYHPGFHNIDDLLGKVNTLRNAGYSIGIYAILHPEYTQNRLAMAAAAADLGLYFRGKPLLGIYEDEMYGEYAYPDPFQTWNLQTVGCRTTELLIAPNGAIHRCHYNLYKQRNPIGQIMRPNETMSEKIRICQEYGNCNPCDLKTKQTRLGEPGYRSVYIYDIIYKDKKNAEEKTQKENSEKSYAACSA